MLEEHVEIINKLGMHARAATKFANTANQFSASVQIALEEKLIDGKSIMSLMLLAASQGSHLTLLTEGTDEQEAMQALTTLIADRFEEEE